MDNDIAGIEHDPVGLAHTFGANIPCAARLKTFAQFFGHGDDVSGRGPGYHDNVISEGGLPAQVNDLNVCAFVGIQRGYDKVFKGGRIKRASVRCF